MNNSDYLYENKVSETFINLLKKDYCDSKKLYAIEEENAIILPQNPIANRIFQMGGVLRADGSFIAESAEWKNQVENSYKYNFNNTKIIDHNGIAIYLGAIYTGHWGNFFVDNISRLWYILSLQNREKIKIVYTGSLRFKPNTFGEATKNAHVLFELLGISKEQLVDIRIPSRFKKVIVPQKSFEKSNYFTKEYKTIYDAVRANINLKKEKFEKIYFTRNYMHRKKEVGEKEFERYFTKNGFKVLAPEKLTLKEQIFYVSNCKILASLEGTLAHNVLFANNGLKQIILRKQSEIITRQILLNQASNTSVVYIDVYKEPFKGFPISHDRGPFLLRFNDNIKRFSKDNNMELYRINELAKIIIDDIIYIIKCLQMKSLHLLAQSTYLKKIYNRL